MSLFRRRYGASPLHLLGHVAAFALAAFALKQIIDGGAWINFVVCFAGAAVLHDLVVLPLYSLLDRVARERAPGSHPAAGRVVPVVNHVRAPALISGVLLLVYFPEILGPAGKARLADSGHHLNGYLRNWLLITAGLFLASAIVYAIRLRRAR
jgi:hypothetical protein